MEIQAWWDRRSAASLRRMYPERDIRDLMRRNDPVRDVPHVKLLEAADAALASLMERIRNDGMPVVMVPVWEGRSIQSSRAGNANTEWRTWWGWPAQIDVPVPVGHYSWGDSRADQAFSPARLAPLSQGVLRGTVVRRWR